jgi:electron transfer flavoprotein alpha subunit
MSKRIVIVSEEDGGRISAATREAVGLGRELRRRTGAEPVGLALTGEAERLAREWARDDGLRVYFARCAALGRYEQRSFLSALEQALGQLQPSWVLVAHTPRGFDFAPRLAARLGMSYVAAATGVGEGGVFLRSVLGGKMTEEVRPAADRAVVVTVSPGSFRAEAGALAGPVLEVRVDPAPPLALEVEIVRAPARKSDLDRAEVVVTAGRGAGEEGIALARELAASFPRGALAATRPLVDAGLLPYELQVGQTGRTVAPKVYIACGVSGAIQHTAGMSGSNLVVAINTDRNAPIFRLAGVGAVMDLRLLLPALIERLKKESDSN